MTVYNDNIKRGVVHQLFPTPVFIDQLDRPFTPEEAGVWEQLSKTTRPNLGNQITPEYQVLDLAEFSNLKQEIELRLQDYVRRVINPQKPLELRITQSWINYTHEGEYHHPHVHTNSWLSGVVYLQTDDQDSIWFDKPQGIFDIPPIDHNIFNSTSWRMPVRTGTIVMFPSQLEHRVDVKRTTGVRISLAFNTWIHGNLGHEEKKTHLSL